MNKMIYIKRTVLNKKYWLSSMAALVLLLCCTIYINPENGQKYLFISAFYDNFIIERLGIIDLKSIFLGYDKGYLWMFASIIVNFPCLINQKTERFLIFRTGKNRYIFGKYFSNLVMSGFMMVISYFFFLTICMVLAKKNLFDIYAVKKLVSVFIWGMYLAVPGLILSEYIRNKYLILCIPFVINYFMCTFVTKIVKYDIYKYFAPDSFQILLLTESKQIIVSCIILTVLIIIGVVNRKILFERRLDCGQK
ncbi:MAG: hypothetical protein SOY46_00670 [Butyrivibrio crossotus]|nr:hypothetical protein [Butyrivibrio crossotus]